MTSAKVLVGPRKIEVKILGIRPGEKVHEILVSEEEAFRTVKRGHYYAIRPMLPEVCGDARAPTDHSRASIVRPAM